MAGMGEAKEGRGLGYRPALDGLRAVAVVAVLLFHSGFEWARGGYLGVSAFFTLSGFLITSLLLDERRRTGSISLRRFWGRRIRRLMPAAMATIALGAIWVATSAPYAVAADFRADGFAALFDVANWRFIAADRGYLDTFALATGTTLPQSPVLHFWSLAIEEQFYLLFPPLLLGLSIAARGRRTAIGAALALLAAGSVGLGLWLGTGADNSRAYFGTDTRAAELLVGALLAVTLQRRIERPGTVSPGTVSRGAALAGPIAFAVLVIAWALVDHQDPLLFRGGLLVHALLTAAVIGALLVPGPLASVMSWRPLVGLGRISYGVYLYHWVVFQRFDARATGLAPGPLLALRCAITLTVAVASYFLLEQPIRNGLALRPARLAAVPAASALVAVILVSTSALPAETTVFSAVGGAHDGTAPVASRRPAALADYDDIPAPPVTITSSPLTGPSVTSPTVTSPTVTSATGGPVTSDSTASHETVEPVARVERVLVVGDSVALTLGRGIERWGFAHRIAVWNIGRRMCGLGRGRLLVGGTEIGPSPGCDSWPQLYASAVDTFDPDVVVVLSPVWDAMPHRHESWPEYRVPGDPVYDAWLLGEYSTAADMLTSDGARVVWLDVPCVEGRGTNGTIDALNAVIERIADARDDVDRVSLAAVLCEPARFTGARSDDGFHFTDPGADELAAWLGPQLLDENRGDSGANGSRRTAR
jgi:peptidoglycan/LPS O-acetylase OafA/YrhL